MFPHSHCEKVELVHEESIEMVNEWGEGSSERKEGRFNVALRGSASLGLEGRYTRQNRGKGVRILKSLFQVMVIKRVAY